MPLWKPHTLTLASLRSVVRARWLVILVGSLAKSLSTAMKVHEPSHFTFKALSVELLREFLILDNDAPRLISPSAHTGPTQREESSATTDTTQSLAREGADASTPPPPVFPRLDFSITLKMCSVCIAFMLNNLTPLERNTNGLTPLTFHLCDACYAKNKLGYLYFREESLQNDCRVSSSCGECEQTSSLLYRLAGISPCGQVSTTGTGPCASQSLQRRGISSS